MRRIVFAFALLFALGCNKGVKVERKEMTVDEVVKILGFNPFNLTNNPNERKPAKPGNAVVVVWFNDLALTKAGNTYTTTLPENPKWGGVQNLTNLTSLCNWYFGGYYSASTISCVTDAVGQIRSWSSDVSDNIHISNTINP